LAQVRRIGVVVSAVLTLAAPATMLAGTPASALTPPQLQSKVLTLNNLPTGWAVSTFNALGELPDCISGLQLNTAAEHETVSASFRDGTLPLLEEDVGWVSSGASGDYKLIVQALRGCRKPFVVSLDAVPATVTIEPMSFRTYGDRSSAFAMGTAFRYDGVPLSTGTDIVVFQVGRIVGVLFYGELGIPRPSLSGSFVTEAIDKIQGKAIPLSLLVCEVRPSCPSP
jgi:hypothetical protein